MAIGSRSHSLLALFLLILTSYSVNAKVLSSEGYGKDREASQQNALSSLAKMIFVQVESESKAYQNDQGENYFNSTMRSSTDLPIIGVEFSCYEFLEGVNCSANMDTRDALPMYMKQLTKLTNSIDAQIAELEKIKLTLKYEYLSALLAKYEQFEKFQTVVTFMSAGEEELPQPAIRKQMLKNEIAELSEKVASMELAAKFLSQNIRPGKIFVKPATIEGSREVTPFASSLHAHLKRRLQSVAKPDLAEHFFSGSYQITDDGIQVSYSLVDNSGQSIKTNVVQLAPSSYKNLRAKPAYPDFDSLLHKGYAVSSDFNIQLNTNIGSRQLLFKGGDTVEILVKMNRAGYFYLVGHSKNEEVEQSYLLDISEARGNRRFVQYTNADDVNKWVSLGEFEAVPPYGVESIQVVASETDLVDRLPGYYYDEASEYYILSKDIKQGVTKTRSLKKKKKKNKGKETSTVEAVLLFTTQE